MAIFQHRFKMVTKMVTNANGYISIMTMGWLLKKNKKINLNFFIFCLKKVLKMAKKRNFGNQPIVIIETLMFYVVTILSIWQVTNLLTW